LKEGRMHVSLRRFILCLIVLIFAASGMAQVATGTYAYGTFDNKGFDTVNVGNLNVHFSIPVLNKAGRGIPFSYNLSFDNSVWYPTAVSGAETWTPATLFGWQADTTAATGFVSYTSTTTTTPDPGGPIAPTGGKLATCTVTTYSNWTYYDTFGTAHPFAGATSKLISGDGDSCPEPSPSLTGITNDGSGYTITIFLYKNVAVTSAGGKKITPAVVSNSSGSVTDSNGNQISIDINGHFTDTTGKVALTVAGTAPNPHTFTYTDTGGNPQSVTMSYKSYTVQTNFGCSGIGEYGPTSTSLVDAISFPDGSAYHFTYEPTPGNSANVTGRLASVTLPAGGVINYTYSGGNNGIECGDGSSAGLTRTISGDSGSAASTWSYSRSVSGSTSQTAVIDGMQNHSTYNFVLGTGQSLGVTADYYETNRTIDQGSGGTPLLSRATCYNGAAQPCAATALTLPIAQIDTYETLNGVQQHGMTQKYNIYGLETEEDDYDFGGASSRGSLLRKEIWTYPSSGIVNLMSSDIVYDGSGNVFSETTYGYDGAAPTASSGVPQHIAVSGQRGNRTTMTQYSAFNSLTTTTYTYEDTGSVLTATTPGGKTSYSYDSTFVYQQGVTPPTPSSGVSLPSSAAYDTANTGMPRSSTDPNGTKTSIASYDDMLRPTEIDVKDSGGNMMGKTTYGYSPTESNTYSYQNSNTVGETAVQYDSHGRASRVGVENGQGTNPWYLQDTCYDANGNVNFQSYKYQGSAWATPKVCSNSGDTYSYDALGRVKTITHADGTTVSYTYTGRATEVVDENSVTKISQVDGLGRTMIVCEISSNSTMPNSGSVGTCGTDIAGTGFTTAYSYNLQNHTVTVTQGAQTRTFQTDWLGRTIMTQEPERGLTNYNYAYNSTGLVVTRTRPTANQTSTSTLTTTTTQYDALGRVLTVAYNDGVTPNKNFNYDTNCCWTQNTPTNMKGRLVVFGVQLGSSTTRWAGDLLSYDAVGRVINSWACTPTTCGTSNQTVQQISYAWDWTGNLTSEQDWASGQISYTRSLAGEVQQIVNNTFPIGSSGAVPATLVSSVVNGPDGPISYSLGNGLSQFNSYDALGRRNGGWVCVGAPSLGCAAQRYGFAVVSRRGSQMLTLSDDWTGQSTQYTYDGFNRLQSTTVGANPLQDSGRSFSYTYDRYGNRWQQNAPQGGNSFSVSFNEATNQINSGGYAYDAAGNMTNDGSHSYTYDAEGNILNVDNGSTATYVYDAFNRRIRSQVAAGATQQSFPTEEYLYDYAGRMTSIWNPATVTGVEGIIYWGKKQIAFRDGPTYFDHQDYLGTERTRTDSSGNTVWTNFSLPWGDGGTGAFGGVESEQNMLDFAGLTTDTETGTQHAQFRQYSPAQGHWMSPDPYSGSYDFSNPQSFNRYAYVLNNPLSFRDRRGLDVDCATNNGDSNDDDGCGSDGGDTCVYSDPCGGLAPGDPGPDPVPGPDPDPCDGADICIGNEPLASNNNNQPQNTNQQQQTAQQAPGLCTAIVHAGNTTVGLAGVVVLWGTLADAGVVTAPAGVALQTSGAIGAFVGGIGIAIGDAGLGLGICH
jgi:RHS repeat-associated protein